jgi:hypothetical protein
MKKLIFAFILVLWCLNGAVFTAAGEQEDQRSSGVKGAAGFEFERLVVATGVDQRVPVGIADTFPSSTPQVICFLDAKNITSDQNVIFVWILNGKEVLKKDLKIKAGPRWRTRAIKNLHGQKGDWKVEIRDASGAWLKDISFKVE